MSVTRPWVFALVMCCSRGRWSGGHGINPHPLHRQPLAPFVQSAPPTASKPAYATDRYLMSSTRTVRTDQGGHFSCSMSAVALARVEAFGGAEAVDEVLRLAGSRRSRAYLADITNWIAYDEAIALWRA